MFGTGALVVVELSSGITFLGQFFEFCVKGEASKPYAITVIAFVGSYRVFVSTFCGRMSWLWALIDAFR